MRAMIVVTALLLTGCGPEWQARMARAQAERQAYLNSPAGRAEAICLYKADAAMAGRNRRTLIDLEGDLMQADLKQRCMDIYWRTGVMPSI